MNELLQNTLGRIAKNAASNEDTTGYMTMLSMVEALIDLPCTDAEKVEQIRFLLHSFRDEVGE